MSHKLLPRLGTAIASTILSYAGVSLAGVNQAQAAVLTYNFHDVGGISSGFFKFSNSSLTGIGYEGIAVSEGRLYGPTLRPFFEERKEYYNLAGARASFYQGDFRGLGASGGDYVTKELIIPPDEPYGPLYVKWTAGVSWAMASNYVASPSMWISWFWGGAEEYIAYNGGSGSLVDRSLFYNPVSYKLVKTEAEPVPEPLTAGGTALALAGLSWLKHKKKMAA
jgi:hypothetical protein